MSLKSVQVRKHGVMLVAMAVFCLGMPHALAAPSCFGEAATKVGTEVKDFIKGTPGRDVIVTLAGGDTVWGLGGDDLICTGADIDVVLAGPGPDRVDGGDNHDVLRGGAGRDRLFGHEDSDNLWGGPGADFLSTGAGHALWGSSTVYGGAGNDTIVTVSARDYSRNRIFGGAGDDRVFGGAGKDRIQGQGGGDSIAGGANRDFLEGGAGNDEWMGGPGNDVESGDLGNDLIAGGEGSDAVSYESLRSGGVAVDLAAGSASGAGTDTLIGIENVWGTHFDDRLAGDESANELVGSGGDDSLDGGGGRDLVDYSNSSSKVAVNLQSGKATGEGRDSIIMIEDIAGSNVGDLIVGDANDNQLQGHQGADVLRGAGGHDQLLGGPHPDRMNGGPGDDDISGGGFGCLRRLNDVCGNDRYGDEADFSTSTMAISANLENGTATGDGNDVLVGIENLTGSVQDDSLTGDDNANILSGGIGNDAISGAAGDDIIDFSGLLNEVTVDLAAGTAVGEGTDELATIEGVIGSDYADVLHGDGATNRLYGGMAVDKLFGLAGDDILQGGKGSDVLDGGAGSDAASFADSTTGVTADLEAGLAEGFGADNLILIESVFGSRFSDFLRSDDGANTLRGERGDDVLEGRAGDDDLGGGPGVDNLSGGQGADQCAGEVLLACE